jgi:hypothetical protein
MSHIFVAYLYYMGINEYTGVLSKNDFNPLF